MKGTTVFTSGTLTRDGRATADDVTDNPILASFRETIEGADLGQAGVEFAGTWAAALAGGTTDPTFHQNSTPTQIKHACKTLGRYARIYRTRRSK